MPPCPERESKGLEGEVRRWWGLRLRDTSPRFLGEVGLSTREAFRRATDGTLQEELPVS